MSDFVVDTNVLIVANNRPPSQGERGASIDCRMATVRFLMQILSSGRIFVDLEGEIQHEYRRYLRPSGEPGVGDRFYLEVLKSSPERIVRSSLRKRADGEYADLPKPLVDVGFDPSDRVFAALARKEDVPVANAVDGDWIEHRATLEKCGIVVKFVCGDDTRRWFQAD